MHWIPDYLSVELEIRILIVSGIPDSLSWIVDSNAQDSGFNNHNLCRIRDYFTRGEESENPSCISLSISQQTCPPILFMLSGT